MTLALTYLNQAHRDGAGAQWLRVFGIYALARGLRVPYVHSPVLSMDNHGLQAALENRRVDGYEARWNRALALPSMVRTDARFEVLESRDVTVDKLEAVRTYARHRNVLLKILYPYRVLDEQPHLWRAASEASPYHRIPLSPSVVRIAMHVRRGDVEVIRAKAPDRWLDNSYYIQLAQQLASVFEACGVPYLFELYTEVPANKTTLTPGVHPLFGTVAPGQEVDPFTQRCTSLMCSNRTW